MTPAVAVVIPTYNQAEYLPVAVRSAVAQDYGGPLEVWVVDDASTDETPVVLEQLRREFPELRIRRQDANVGIARNVTDALRAPSTDYVVRLDSDDILERTFVRQVAEMMARYPDSAYGHTAVREIGPDGQQRRVRRLARKTGFQPAEVALRASLSGYRTTANIMMFKKAALEAANYYEKRPDYVEDYDLSVRLADAGFGNVYTTDVLARYRVWDDAGGLRARRKSLQLAGFDRIFAESMSPAWKRRGWDVGELSRQRRRLAAHHCASCFAPQYTDAEREELVRLLLRLGDGPALRVRLALCRLGLRSTVERADSFPLQAKATLKNVLSTLGVYEP